MVRLKARFQGEWAERDYISIPCGSIKSFMERKSTLHKIISIPCGSIKSSSDSFSKPAKYISIPCGSIKRIRGDGERSK